MNVGHLLMELCKILVDDVSSIQSIENRPREILLGPIHHRRRARHSNLWCAHIWALGDRERVVFDLAGK